MNILTGIIHQIQQSGAILLVDVDVNGQNFSAFLIESAMQPQWLKTGNVVDVVFKETEVILAKELSGMISSRNRMKCSVLKVERGELLSKITLQFKKHIITSAITTRSVDALKIALGDEVEALVKSNEISLMEKKIKSF